VALAEIITTYSLFTNTAALWTCSGCLRLPNSQNMSGLYTAPGEGGVADAPLSNARPKEKSLLAISIKRTLFLWVNSLAVNG